MSDEKPPCSKCGGMGKIQIDDSTVTQCICSFAKAMKEHLGSEIALAPVLKNSPLFVAGKPEPAIDRTKDNLFLKGYWSDLLPHFKAALLGKGLFFQFKIVTDEKLKTVYVGDDSYKARNRNRRDDIETNNSLADLVGPDTDLVIVQLGFLIYPNKAMPEILREALMIREAASKPSWLIEDPDHGYFGPGHRSYDEGVDEYIRRRFQVVDLTNKNHALTAWDHVASDHEDIGADAPPPPVEKVYVERSRFEAPVDLGALNEGGGGRKKAPWKGKKSSGGGPLG